MGRVALALVLHEFMERTRDRWVVVSTALFALLALAITLYGRSSMDTVAAVTAPSLVTLSALLVPLVALILGYDAIVGERERHTLGLLLSLPVSRTEVLVAKFAGRLIALCAAIALGLGSSSIALGGPQRTVLLYLIPPTILLGAAFLALGVLISTVSERQSTAASLAVAAWFLMVFFYDLGLLSAMVATDGALSQSTVAWLVDLNPVGLYRTTMMMRLIGTSGLADLGLAVELPGPFVRTLIWAGWVAGPLAFGSLWLGRRRAVTA